MKQIYRVYAIKKRFLLSLLICLVSLVIFIGYYSRSRKAIVTTNLSQDEVYEQTIIRFLMPSINTFTEGYYGQYLSTIPTVTTYTVTIQEVKKSGGYYLIKVKIRPYIGAHITIGEDDLTYRLEVDGEVVLVDHNHLKSYSIAPWLQGLIINWPPEGGEFIEYDEFKQ